MENKSLLYGLIGFFIGGLLVAIAATTINKPVATKDDDMTMSQMVASLKDKTGDEYDKAFIADMITHHQSAVDMAKLSATNAKHSEVKQLSQAIIAAQEKEISQMHQWQMDWGYATGFQPHEMNEMSH